jgi:hypothetical protein
VKDGDGREEEEDFELAESFARWVDSSLSFIQNLTLPSAMPEWAAPDSSKLANAR